MEFRLLGPLEAWHDDNLVNLGDLQQRYVLAVLLLRPNQPFSAERLSEIIWAPEKLAEQKKKAKLVVTYVYRLRQVLQKLGVEEVDLAKEPTGYALRVDPRTIDYV